MTVDPNTASGSGDAPHEGALSLVELSRDESLGLIGGAGIGRVVFSANCLPVAFPVNIALVDEAVVFATGFGVKFDAASRGEVLTVQADDVDRIYHTGWSVLVTGVAEVIERSDAPRWAESLFSQSWLARTDSRLVRVPATVVSGRRLQWAVPDAPGAVT